MLLITPPAAGTKASTHFTQHSFSFPFYFSTNKNIVILNKQLGVSLISVFSLRWFGRASLVQLFLPQSYGWEGAGRSPALLHTPGAKPSVCSSSCLWPIHAEEASGVSCVSSFLQPHVILCRELSPATVDIQPSFWALPPYAGSRCCPSTKGTGPQPAHSSLYRVSHQQAPHSSNLTCLTTWVLNRRNMTENDNVLFRMRMENYSQA